MPLSHPQQLGFAAAVACVAFCFALAAPVVARSADTTASDSYAGKSTIQGAERVDPLVPGHPTWPENPQPLPPRAPTAQTSSSGFDWGAAGIGAGSTAALAGVTVAAIAIVMRRRRKPARSPSLVP